MPRIIEMYQDKDRAQGEELAEQISAQVAQEIAPYVDGFYLITPFKRVEAYIADHQTDPRAVGSLRIGTNG